MAVIESKKENLRTAGFLFFKTNDEATAGTVPKESANSPQGFSQLRTL